MNHSGVSEEERCAYLQVVVWVAESRLYGGSG